MQIAGPPAASKVPRPSRGAPEPQVPCGRPGARSRLVVVVATEERRDVTGRKGLRVEEALTRLHVLVAEPRQLARLFDALGDRLEPEGLPQLDERVDDRRASGLVVSEAMNDWSIFRMSTGNWRR